MHKTRLLLVAQALRESPAPEDFSMDAWRNLCGTPACALGHYCAREDLQDAFRWHGRAGMTIRSVGEHAGLGVSFAAREHFGIDENQFQALFGGAGCGGAQTVEQAAEYIERFVATDGAL